MYKRATLYSSEVNEVDGERERVTVSTKFNMPSVHKFAADFAKALKQVLERGCERCTSDIKKDASQCLLWGIHINSCIGAAPQDVATPHLKNLLAYALAYDPDLRTFGLRANMAQPMIDGLQTQLASIIAERWDIILKHK